MLYTSLKWRASVFLWQVFQAEVVASLTWITSIMPIKAASMTGQSREEWLVLDLDEDLVDRLFQDGVHFFKDL